MDADIALIQGMADADPFAEQLAAETPRMRAWIARLVPRRDVDDLVQDTLTKAWRYRSALESGKALGPWLRGTALRVALDHRAKLQREPRTCSLEDEPTARSVPAHVIDSTFDAHEEVDALLLRLDATEREVMVRFHRLGQSIGEIAAGLSLPVGTVKSHLHRARRKLARDGRSEDGE